MEEVLIIPNDLLQNVILPNVWVRTLLESCTRVCRQWNNWISPKFWEKVFKTQFGKVTIQIIPPITNLNWRRMCIEASKSLRLDGSELILLGQIPPTGTIVTINKEDVPFSIEDVIYCTSLKMRKTYTGEVLDLEPEFFRPMIQPGTKGHPAIAEGIRVLGRWKKQSFWSGTLKRVDHIKKQVDIHWEDDDKGTIDFDEVYAYPTDAEVLEIRKQILENTLDPKTQVFASRTDLAKSGRCGPYHPGTMDHISCHWSLLLSNGNVVSPTAVTVKKQLTIPQVYSKIENLLDKNLMGQTVLFREDTSSENYFVGEVSSDPKDFGSLVVQKENMKEGLYEMRAYYNVIVREGMSNKTETRLMPADLIVRIRSPLIQDLVVGMTVYIYRGPAHVKGVITAIDENSRAIVSYNVPNTYAAEQQTQIANCMEIYKPITL